MTGLPLIDFIFIGDPRALVLQWYVSMSGQSFPLTDGITRGFDPVVSGGTKHAVPGQSVPGLGYTIGGVTGFSADVRLSTQLANWIAQYGNLDIVANVTVAQPSRGISVADALSNLSVVSATAPSAPVFQQPVQTAQTPSGPVPSTPAPAPGFTQPLSTAVPSVPFNSPLGTQQPGMPVNTNDIVADPFVPELPPLQAPAAQSKSPWGWLLSIAALLGLSR